MGASLRRIELDLKVEQSSDCISRPCGHIHGEGIDTLAPTHSPIPRKKLRTLILMKRCSDVGAGFVGKGGPVGVWADVAAGREMQSADSEQSQSPAVEAAALDSPELDLESEDFESEEPESELEPESEDFSFEPSPEEPGPPPFFLP
jgi:hypothetical protein